MRRILSLALVSFTVAIAGCGGVDNTAVPPKNPAPPPKEGPAKEAIQMETLEAPTGDPSRVD